MNMSQLSNKENDIQNFKTKKIKNNYVMQSQLNL